MGEEKDETDDTLRQDIFRTMGQLKKLHNIIVHICRSADRTKEFKNLAERIIPLDNRTR